MKQFIESRTRARLKKLTAELHRAAKAPGNEKRIHDLRVAIRRMNQCLRTFKQFFEPKDTKPIRKHLRKLMDRCGAARNFDVALELIDAAGLQDGDLPSKLNDSGRKAKNMLAQRLAAWRKQWRFRLPASRDKSGTWDGTQSPEENAHRILPALVEELFAAGDEAIRDTAKGLHKFRLEVKHFRYTVELFHTFYGPTLDSGLAMLRTLQDRLGAVSDCIATLSIVKEDRRATQAIRKLLSSREAEFRTYWKAECGPQTREWWKTTLSGAKHGTLHTKAR